MKISEVMSMPECHWVRAHLTQYLDRDPAAPLSPAEITRIESHIAICERCASISEDYRETSKALSQYRKQADQESIARLSNSLKKLTADD
jgi:predicted anti-sigma-YlaC factor YlaD